MLRRSVFESIRWEIEVRGRLLQFKACQNLLKNLAKVFTTFSTRDQDYTFFAVTDVFFISQAQIAKFSGSSSLIGLKMNGILQRLFIEKIIILIPATSKNFRSWELFTLISCSAWKEDFRMTPPLLRCPFWLHLRWQPITILIRYAPQVVVPCTSPLFLLKNTRTWKYLFSASSIYIIQCM